MKLLFPNHFNVLTVLCSGRLIGKLMFTLLIALPSIDLYSQQIPYLNHYYYDSYLLNPADAGDHENIRASLFLRQQWVGIPGAPETQSLIVHGKIPQRKFGLGVSITNDATDVLSRFSALASASYTVQLSSLHELSFGMSAGMLRYQLSFDKIRADVTDEGLLKNAANSTKLEGVAGLTYRLKQFRLGFVSEQLFNRAFTFVNEADAKSVRFALVRHYTVYARYEFQLNTDFSVRPLLMLRSAQGLSSQFDLNTLFKFRDLAWINLQHRIQSGSGISIGAAITKQLNLGYTYEVPSTPIKAMAAASHEVMLSMKFMPQKRSGSKALSETSNNGVQNSSTNEQLDELRQKNEAMQAKLLDQKRTLDQQKNEISLLRQAMQEVEMEIRQMIRKDSVDLGSDEDFDKGYEYLVVIGAVRKISDARLFQKMIQRELGVSSEVKQNHWQTWYFIYSGQVNSRSEAIKEIRRLRELGIEPFIIGNPWVYKSPIKK